MDVFFNAPNIGSWSANNPLNGGSVGLPSGRAMSDGFAAAMIAAMTASVNGRGASRSVTLQLQGITTSNAFTVGNGGTGVVIPPLVGWIGSSAGFVQGGFATALMHLSGAVNYGRSSANHDWWYGGYQWYQAPEAPLITTFTPTAADSATFQFTFGGDQGGTGITNYVIQLSYDNFVTVWYELTTQSGGPHYFSGMTPGALVYARVAAQNSVTNIAGRKGGAWSPTVTAKLLSGGGERYDGSTWKDLVTRKRYTTSATWVDLSTKKRWTGSAWVDLVNGS